jgi:hypothetical protein
MENNEVEKVEAQPTARKTAPPVEVNDDGKFEAKTAEGQFRIAKMYIFIRFVIF